MPDGRNYDRHNGFNSKFSICFIKSPTFNIVLFSRGSRGVILLIDDLAGVVLPSL